MPYHSAKGLTFDSVLLPRLTPADVLVRSTSSLLRLLFVGITRATAWVYLSAVEGEELLVLHALAAGAAEVVVRRNAVHADEATEQDDDESGPVLVVDDSLTAWL